MATYVSIGDGAASMAAAQTVRAEDAEATVTVLSDEPSPYYYRTALTNYLLGQLRDEQLWGVPQGSTAATAPPVSWTVLHATLDQAGTMDGSYPSGIALPTAGCWRLTAHLGQTLASVTLRVTG